MKIEEIKTIYSGGMFEREIGCCVEGRYAGWLFAKHPDGQWVTIAKIPEIAKEDGQPGDISEDALNEALLTLRPQVWQDITQQVMLGEIPAAQLPMKVEMWSVQFRPFLKAAIQAYLVAATKRESIALFKYGAFTSHSGLHLPDKIDCDALTKADWDTLAAWVARRVGFGKVVGIETGGNKFAEALQQHCSPFGPVLIVDDVLTTGKSMEEARAQYPDAVGAVVFSRTKNIPEWIIARFVESNEIEDGETK